jgi:hypothetical protein
MTLLFLFLKCGGQIYAVLVRQDDASNLDDLRVFIYVHAIEYSFSIQEWKKRADLYRYRGTRKY